MKIRQKVEEEAESQVLSGYYCSTRYNRDTASVKDRLTSCTKQISTDMGDSDKMFVSMQNCVNKCHD
jgi:hypothetical protein